MLELKLLLKYCLQATELLPLILLLTFFPQIALWLPNKFF